MGSVAADRELGDRRTANCWQGHWRQAGNALEADGESRGENRRMLDGSAGSAGTDLGHVRRPGGWSSKMRREALREAHAREAR